LGNRGRLVERVALETLRYGPSHTAIKNQTADLRDALELKNDPEAEEFVKRVDETADAEAATKLIREEYDRLRTVTQVAEFARRTLQEVTPRQQSPEDADWERLGQHVARSRLFGGSLIYDYWLDEAGLPWTLERLADRIENGLSRHTQALMAVRASQDSTVAAVISMFTVMWQRGELAALDERRRQYDVLYGFPVHAAGKWGPLETVDPRGRFPLAFHRFLNEAMRFYRERRNRLVDADPQATLEAFSALVDALREGNENLRLVRPPEIRAQFEYTKQALGGYAWPAAGAPSNLASEWRAVLPGRPGVRDALEPWQHAVETVAGLYTWKRPGIRDYVTLAEWGETILVLSRIVGELQPIDSGVWLAFLLLMQDPITRYVNAFKAVAAVDLETRPYPSPPAEALAKRYVAPAVPPLKRSWGADVPAGV
jgi:hypothetical protein